MVEVGTDRERFDSWNKEAAIKANITVADFGIERDPMVEEALTGYIAQHLDGIWLRAPYLCDGSVPTLRDLLNPAAQRLKAFYRDYDIYDQNNLGFGFVSQGEEAELKGMRFEVSDRANGNTGHLYGTTRGLPERDALSEYLKTL